MAAQAGRDIIISLNTTGVTYVPLAGLQPHSISFDNELIDITNSDSSGRWRELLANGGVKSCTITGDGVFTDAAIDENLRAMMVADDAKNMRFLVPSFSTIQGLFMVSNFEYSGDHDGEVRFSATFQSSGPLTFTAA